MHSNTNITSVPDSIDNIVSLLDRALDQGVSVFIQKDKLRLKFEKGMTPEEELIKALKIKKPEIKNFLEQQEMIQQQVSILKPDLSERKGSLQVPLSFSQERLWFIDKFEGSSHYHVPTVLRMKGDLDTEALCRAFQEVINRHEVLRTVFRENEDQAWQYVLPKNQWRLSERTVDPNNEREQQTIINDEILKPFDLTADHMVRASIITLSESEYILVLVLHHIASDGWSMPIFIGELLEFYESIRNNEILQLKDLPIQYADYSIWQRENLKQQAFSKKIDYWYDKLVGLPTSSFPTDYPRPAIQSSNGTTLHDTIDTKLTKELSLLSNQQDVTLFMLMLSAFKVLLYKYSGQQDLCIGTPIANRTTYEIEPLIGFFVNTLALRSNLGGNPTFETLLNQVKTTTLEAYEYQDVPFEKIVDRVTSNRDMSHSPLFQVMFVFQNNAQLAAPKMTGVTLSTVTTENTNAKFDLTLDVTETENGLDLDIEYCTDLFEGSTINRIIKHFKALLREIVNNPKKRIEDLNILSPEEENHLVYHLNDTSLAFPENITILDIFRDQVVLSQEQVAIIFEESALSYKDLDNRSNQLANCLIDYGVKPASLVGLCMDRSLEMMVAVLGVLKSGGAYVPIDPKYPEDRKRYMLEDSKVEVLIVDEAVLKQSNLQKRYPNIQTVCIDGAQSLINSYPVSKTDIKVSQTDLAYVIYTSGSTGKPKGVMVEHGNLLNISMSWQQHYNLKETRPTVLSYASFAFDVFTGDYCRALLNGCKMVIASETAKRDMELLYSQIEKHQVNIVEFSPLILKALIDFTRQAKLTMRSLETVIVGGDSCSVNDYGEFKNYLGESARVLNSYGLTETTIDSSYFEGLLDPSSFATGIVPIGKPLHNTSYYIVNSNGSLNPIGVEGELWISGKGVARGYLNNDLLTNERFITDPFNRNGQRLYKTGDVASWLPDGNIKFRGRSDNQVKINGHRIELGEIEKVISDFTHVVCCAVQALHMENGSRRLVGYLVVSLGFDKNELQAYLKDKLPQYMIPNFWVTLDKLPMTSNGKIDKKLLPTPDRTDIGNVFQAASTPEEKVLTVIWEEVLSLNKVGINDNFFELGGNSILSIKVMSKLKVLGYQVSAKDLFQYQTIKALSDFLNNSTHVAGFTNTKVKDTKPSGKTEQMLVEIWEKLFLATCISTKDNFFELGGYFLLALRMIGIIKQKFDIDLDVSILLTHPTIETLATQVEAGQNSQEMPAVTAISNKDGLQNLFCIPGIEGSVLEFYPLSREVAFENNVYVCQPYGIDGKSKPIDTIEEIAKSYIREIQKVKATGPYKLGGYSFGGSIAFEMSKQLIQDGHEVSELIIFDGDSPQRGSFRNENNDIILQGVVKMIADAHQKPFDLNYDIFKNKSLDAKLDAAFLLIKNLNVDISDHYIRGLLNVMIANNNINYLPPKDIKLDVSVTLFKAMTAVIDQPDPKDRPWDYGWQDLVIPKVRVIEVPGTHWTFLKYPNVQKVGDEYKTEMERV